MDTLNSIPILQFSAPTETSLVPHESFLSFSSLHPSKYVAIGRLHGWLCWSKAYPFKDKELKIVTYTLETLSKHVTVFALKPYLMKLSIGSYFFFH